MQFKKRLGSLLVFCLIIQLLLAPGVAAAPQAIQVMINGELVASDPPPVIINERVLVPIRLVEKMQAKVAWDETERKVTVTRGLGRIELWVPDSSDPFDYRSEGAFVNGEYHELDVRPVIIKGRTFVPVRLIAEGLGAQVEWDGVNRRVIIDIAEIKPLTGLAKTVRDSVYNTLMAQSYESKIDMQYKMARYPQLNMIKITEKKDKSGHSYAKGHFLGFVFEAVLYNQMVYVKSPVFNDRWVGLDEFGPQGEQIAEGMRNFQQEVLTARGVISDSLDDTITEIVRVLGEPVVVAEENLGGTAVQKIEFKPTWESYQELQKLDSISELKNLKLAIWIDKDGQYLRKIDFYVEAGKGDQEGWLQLIADYSNLNGDFTVEVPAEITAK
ncbi:MAG: stalk domain-containing protein [Bacillota bacterium]